MVIHFEEAEDFDSFLDPNSAGPFGFGIDVFDDIGGVSGGQYVRIWGGEELQYDGISVPSTGTYNVTLGFATAGGGKVVTIYVPGTTSGETVTFTLPATAGWLDFQEHTVQLHLEAGTKSIRVSAQNSVWFLDTIHIQSP